MWCIIKSLEPQIIIIMKKLIYVFAAMLIAVSACKKEETEPTPTPTPTPTNEAPVVTINSPGTAMVSPGDTVSIDVHIMDDNGLLETAVTLTRASDNVVVWQDSNTTNVTMHHFIDEWEAVLPGGTMMSDFELKVISEDEDGLITEEEVVFHVM
ncbi:MAG: hypothetical protein GY861_08075 [bacterium]|nr:hypothetical protein [bacterium]